MLLPLYDKNPSKRWPLITTVLIVVNMICFWQSIKSGEAADYARLVFERGFVAQRLTQIDSGKPVRVQIEEPVGEEVMRLEGDLSTDSKDVYPTLFTSMFLHGGLLHLAANMWMLWVFGDNVEDRLGRVVYVFFYTVGGLFAMLAQWVSDPSSTTPVIGASGAIAAVLGAYAVTYPNAKVKTLIFIGIPLILSIPSAFVLGAWLLINLIGGLQLLDAAAQVPVETNIAYWTHIGGFLAGVVLMPLLTIGAGPPEKDYRAETEKMFDFQ